MKGAPRIIARRARPWYERFMDKDHDQCGFKEKRRNRVRVGFVRVGGSLFGFRNKGRGRSGSA